MNTKIYMLGTGAAMPINRDLPCIGLRVDSNLYLFDVGEGCQYRLIRAGLGVVKIRSVFITHLHGDHYLGLFGLFQSMHLSNRKDELCVYGPKRLGEIIDRFRELRLLNIGYRVSFDPIRKGEIYKDNKIRVEAFPVDHNIEAYGFTIYVGEKKKIVYTGDTRPFKELENIARNSNILIHEATFTSLLRKEALEQGHSTAADAALIARNAGVKELVLTHISSRYKSWEPIFFDAYRYFKNVTVAEDYMILYL